ncbi:zinc finger protein 533 (predicted), isoform CRA_d [Rattus norvegicus]|uniref:Zinc finger protein 533 (Predicted), isoform CRA_d n=1 Tax=Rattus norvegicus TaxID=10116 RepID=A6HMJ7_RAT|nr:zinc finger protein 533 (predicted), isoform CRA_d [Rattus norvegicus]
MNMASFLRGFEEKGLKNDRPGDQFSKEKKKILFSFCDVCNIQLNSAAQAQVHYDGKSHRKRVKQLSDGQPPPPAQGSVPLLASPCPGPGPGPGTNTSTDHSPRTPESPYPAGCTFSLCDFSHPWLLSSRTADSQVAF